MELKQRIQDYTRDEFTTLVHTLWHGNIQQQDHDKLVDHFDSIVEHPAGADLIFYPNRSISGIHYSIGNVVSNLMWWRQQNSKPGFKGSPVVPPYVRTVETKESRSVAALAKISKTEADVNAAEHAVEQAFQSIAVPLTSIELQQTVSGAIHLDPPATQQLAKLVEDMALIQTAETLIGRALFTYTHLQAQLRFAVTLAEVQAKSQAPWDDSAVHASILQRVNQLNSQVLAALPAIKLRKEELSARIAAAMPWAEQQRIRLAAQASQGPNDVPNTFRASAIAASTHALLLTPTANETAAFESSLISLRFATQSAIARFSWEASSSANGAAGQYTDLLKFSTRLSADERYGFSLPLAEIIPLDGHDLLGMAEAGAEVQLPVRLGSGVVFVNKESREYKHVYLTPTDGTVVPAGVRVRSALFDSEQRTYQFTSDGSAPTTIIWTLPPTLEELSKVLPVPLDSSNHPGIIRPQSIANLLPLPADVEFDDYIIVFPEDSGIAPIYLMLKDRRHYSGVAEGQGVSVSGVWLSEDSATETSIHAHVANQLRGRVFKRFDDCKAAIWKAAATDPVLSAQFPADEISTMLNGEAPSVTHEGTRKTYHLSHVSPATQGGKVYDFDNLRVSLKG